MVDEPLAGHYLLMMIVVTRVGADGSVLTRTVNTESREDAGRWEQLVVDAAPEAPPPYRPRPGEPIYEIRVGGHPFQIAERDLQESLRELALAVLTEGDD